ncbi:ribonuclease P protein component [Patescibacteria group bacterium]
MLKKQNRLTSKFEFNITRKYGGKKSGQHFHMFYLQPKNYTGPAKIGIVISNKFHKSAVKRNKTKRLFREVIRKNLELFPDDLWVVIHPKFHTIDKSYEEINSDFVKTLQKVSFPKKSGD